ncbi:hypothetical protein D3C76_1106250 [compost metagenome]
MSSEAVSKEDFRELEREVSKIGLDVNTLQAEVSHVNRLVTDFVTKNEFLPVKLIVYGLAAGTMGAVMTAIVSSVLAK